MSEKETIPRPPARLILTTPEHFVAFGFGSGLAPVAPGTFGTLAGIPFWLLLMWLPLPAYLLVVLALFVFGCWVCGESARLLRVHDYGGIVFDEIVGLLVACLPMLLLDASLWWTVVAFGLFRAFDILKPWPIRWLDARVEGGFGIMIDDLIAGVFSAAVLYLGLWLLGTPAAV